MCVLLFSENENIANFLKKLFEIQDLKASFEKNFILVGLMDVNADSQKLINEFPPAKAIPCFLFLMIDILEKISFLSCIPLETDKAEDFYTKKLNEVIDLYKKQKNYQCKVKEKVENAIKNRKNQQNQMPSPGLFWNPFYDPMTNNLYSTGESYDPHQNARSNQNYQNRELIEQQNEDYQKIVELSKKQFDENMLKQREEEEKDRELKEQEKKINEAKIKYEEKLKILKEITKDEDEEGPDVMNVLFRFPDGKKIKRSFKISRKIQVFSVVTMIF